MVFVDRETDTQTIGTDSKIQEETHTPMVNWSSRRAVRMHNGDKAVSSINGVKKTDNPHGKECNWAHFTACTNKFKMNQT